MPLYVGSTPVTLGAGPLTRVEASSAVTVTADTTAHTKGAWTELIASTSAAGTMLILTANTATLGTNTATLIDVATGAAGSESAFATNVPIGGWGSTAIGTDVPLPYAIPAGSRISVRIQSVVASGKTASVTAVLLSGGSHAPATSALVTIGSSTSTSRGVALASNGSYTEISASTAAAYRHLVIVPSLASAGAANATADLIVGSGASGSEVEIGRIGVGVNSNEFIYPVPLPAWSITGVRGPVPAGTRIAAKRTGGILDVAVIGVP